MAQLQCDIAFVPERSRVGGVENRFRQGEELPCGEQGICSVRVAKVREMRRAQGSAAHGYGSVEGIQLCAFASLVRVPWAFLPSSRGCAVHDGPEHSGRGTQSKLTRCLKTKQDSM